MVNLRHDDLRHEEGLAYFMVRPPVFSWFNYLTDTSKPPIETLEDFKKPKKYIQPKYVEKALFDETNENLPLVKRPILKINIHELTEPLYNPFLRTLDDDFIAYFSRIVSLPEGELMAVISRDSNTGVYMVERGYIPGKNPKNKIMETEGKKLKGLQSLKDVVEQAIEYEMETGAPVVIRPEVLPQISGNVLIPNNGLENVVLYALNRPI